MFWIFLVFSFGFEIKLLLFNFGAHKLNWKLYCISVIFLIKKKLKNIIYIYIWCFNILIFKELYDLRLLYINKKNTKKIILIAFFYILNIFAFLLKFMLKLIIFKRIKIYKYITKNQHFFLFIYLFQAN